MRKLLVVDGTNLLYRSHHALSRSDLRHAGRPVWAVHGLLTSLVRLIRHTQPAAIVVAFDSPGGCPHRRSLQPSYKATRKPPELDLGYQLEWAPRLLAQCGLYAWQADGWEADDGLASACERMTALGGRSTVVSSDRDVYQLASDLVDVHQPDGTPITDAVAREKYGVSLALYPHMAALRGEPSDNLPGVAGVGAKTASRLVATFGSLEGVLTAGDDALRGVVGPSVVNSLRRDAATARLTFEVAQLRRDLPVDLDASTLVSVQPRVLESLCAESGLPQAGAALAQALAEAALASPAAPVAPPE